MCNGHRITVSRHRSDRGTVQQRQQLANNNNNNNILVSFCMNRSPAGEFDRSYFRSFLLVDTLL